MKRTTNDVLTDVSPGSQMGDLMRNYWHPITFSQSIDPGKTLRVKVLGESLVLFRDSNGELGLISEKCSHRGASLFYGIVEQGKIKCPYHGWTFGKNGTCTHIPHLTMTEKLCDKVTIKAYDVRESGGMIFAYLGNKEKPQFPYFKEYDISSKKIKYAYIPCNWLQIMENSLDPIHLEWLHGHYNNVVHKDQPDRQFQVAEHDKINFTYDDFGIVTKKKLIDQNEDDDDWQVGQWLIFPNILRMAKTTSITMHFRVPIDNENTLYIWYDVEPRQPEHIEVKQVDFQGANGELLVDTIDQQDIMIFLSQGKIADREKEHLVAYDKGIIMLRNLYLRQMKLMKSGKDTLLVFRGKEPSSFIVDLPVVDSAKSKSILLSRHKGTRDK